MTKKDRDFSKRVNAALDTIAAAIPGGELLLSTDQAAFFEAVAERLRPRRPGETIPLVRALARASAQDGHLAIVRLSAGALMGQPMQLADVDAVDVVPTLLVEFAELEADLEAETAKGRELQQRHEPSGDPS